MLYPTALIPGAVDFTPVPGTLPVRVAIRIKSGNGNRNKVAVTFFRPLVTDGVE
jgi:hypothetical protein